MVGQTSLIAKLKSYSIDTLPHSLLFVGDLGCGKHSLANLLSVHYNLDLVDITDSINLETIQDIYLCTVPRFYLIDANRITEKQQNIILKFLEEPTKNIYIILICTSKSILLETILNRCLAFEFVPYSKEELLQFLDFESDVEKLLYYCNTPGQLLSTNLKEVNSLIELSDNIVNNINKTRYSNIFKIIERLDVSNNVNLNLFFRVLLDRIFLKIKDDTSKRYISMYKETSNTLKKLADLRFNREALMQNFLSKLWSVSRE